MKVILLLILLRSSFSNIQCDRNVTVTEDQELFVKKLIDKVKNQQLTMVSKERLDNVALSAWTVIKETIPGDFVETGVWRGGCSMISKAVALISNQTQCHANWLFDSFQGLPSMTENDLGIEPKMSRKMDPPGSYNNVNLDHVVHNFRTMLNDDLNATYFVKGWFNSTVSTSLVNKISILRLDGDLYSSTMEVLDAFYPRVVSRGFVIIDDYGHWPQCKRAIHDYFDGKLKMDISKLLIKIDYTGVYFRKP